MKAKRLKEKNKTKKSIAVLIMVFLIIIIFGLLGYILYCNTTGATNIIFQKYSLNKESEQNVSNELLKEKEFEGMQVKDISIKKEDGIVYFSANIENNTDQNFEGKDIKIKFVNEANKPIANFKTKIEPIASKEAVSMQISTSMNITRAYDFIIE